MDILLVLIGGLLIGFAGGWYLKGKLGAQAAADLTVAKGLVKSLGAAQDVGKAP